uniref:Gfo/Idh/MocA family protein n=1 Tax=Vaginimicrobium propionicum TaxID=1871034 RepID=UPI000970C16F|nr:Gfo/Idh/MocA family oxidoreductase [Vaginimicrobium propionicum]
MAVKKAAIVGCGDVYQVHLEAINALDDIELVAVCDNDPAQLALAEHQTGVVGFDSIAKLLESTDCDVVHITTPHFAHADCAIAALEAGKNVILEKPLAHTIADGQRIIDAAAKATSKIGICLQNRYNVSSQRLRRLLDEGVLGEIQGGSAQVMWTRTPDYYHAKPWRGTWEGSGGGLMINQAYHTIDLAQWLMGPVIDVKGQANAMKFGDVIEVEDSVQAMFTNESGTQTSFFASLTMPYNHPVEVEVVGSLGRALIRDGLTVWFADGSQKHWQERKAPSVGRTYWGVSHQLLIEDFYQKLDDTEPFWITPAESMKTLQILKKIYDQSPAFTNHN